MDDLLSLVHHNPVLLAKVLFGAWLVSAIAGALPDPKPNSSTFYVFLHNFAQTLVANLPKISLRNQIPTPQEKPKE